MTMTLLLASSSVYRRELLARLGLAFLTASPDVDETPRSGESVPALVERLSRLKAQTLANKFSSSLIIGSDQAATLQGASIGKPGTRAAAVAQLQAASGQTLVFYTGVCVLDPRDETGVRYRCRPVQQTAHEPCCRDVVSQSKTKGSCPASLWALLQ